MCQEQRDPQNFQAKSKWFILNIILLLKYYMIINKYVLLECMAPFEWPSMQKDAF